MTYVIVVTLIASAYLLGWDAGRKNLRRFLVSGRDSRVSHVVLYKTYAPNLQAADLMVTRAYEWLSVIPGLLSFHAAAIAPATRSVTSADFDVMLNMVFESERAKQQFFLHPYHTKWVDWVLRGWMLERDKNSRHWERSSNFQHAIMEGLPGQPINKHRDWECLNTDVVWDGEQVYDTE